MQKVHMKWTKMSILETQMDQEMWNFSHFLRHFSHFLQISKVNDFSSYIFWIVEVSRFQNVPYLLRDILFNLYPGSGTVWAVQLLWNIMTGDVQNTKISSRKKLHYILSSFNSVPINSYNLVYDYMISFWFPLHVTTLK